jgi:hypothetical protein
VPRIEKVRLVGIKYDSMRKQYQDTTIDLINGMEPAHTLLTLMNGGGKGLLLQAIFQLLLPLTRWGAKGENRIEALFYNERKQFQPYTFHIVLEWRLDTDPVKWLMIGIVVSAREKASAVETEHETAEPQFLLYTLEQIKPGRYEIEDLPLYDSESNTTVSFEDWKEYLAAHRSDFTTYTHTQMKDYFELLKSYDIDRKEWETMRDINRQEGGVEAFFRKGLDNHSLFHDLIIPEISKHMASTDSEGNPGTLLEIFKHNASIAQHLPRLLKREEGYRLLLQEIEPVMQSLQQGAGHENDDREHGRRGAYLRHAMKEWQGEQGKEKEQWQAELGRVEEEAKELRWQEDNLEYAVKQGEVFQLEQKLETSRGQIKRKEESVQDCKEQEAYAHATLFWNERQLLQHKVERIRQELELLQNADEHRHVKEELQQSENRLREEWNAVSVSWKETISGYESLVGQMESDMVQSEQGQKTLQAFLQEKHRALGNVTGQLQTLNTEKVQMERVFGRLANEAPEKLMDQILKQREGAERNLKDKEQERERNEQEKEMLQSRLVELQERIRQLKETILKTEQSLSERREMEKEQSLRLASFLKKELPEASDWHPPHSWFSEAQTVLIKKLEFLDEDLIREQQELWTHQLDSSLAKQPYWIPNQELKKLKEELDSQGLHCYYGSEFMAALPDEERYRYLHAYPLLPFSVVLLEVEWKKRDPKRMGRLLLRAPVPIYLRSQMRGNDERTMEALNTVGTFELQDGALLLSDEGTELVRDPDCWERWKRELHAQSDEFLQNIELLKECLEGGRELEQDLKILFLNADSWTLGLKLEQLKKQDMEFEQQRNEVTETRGRVLERITQFDSEIDVLRTEVDEGNVKLEKLDVWGKRLEQGSKWKQQKAGLENELTEREIELTLCSERVKGIGKELLTWRQAFLSWSTEQKQMLDQIKRLIRDTDFSFVLHGLKHSIEVDSVKQSVLDSELFASRTARLQLLVTEAKALSASMEENSQKIAELNLRLGYETDYVTTKETELDRLYPTWRQEGFPIKPLEVVRSEHDDTAKRRGESIQELQVVQSQFDRLTGQLDSEKNRLTQLERDIRRKHGKAAEAWIDVNLDAFRSELDRRLEKNKSDLTECRRLLSNLDKTIGLLDMQLRVLASQRTSGESVYDIPTDIRHSVRSDAAVVVELWLEKARILEEMKKKLDREVAEKRSRFVQLIRNQDWDADLSGSLQHMMGEIRWEEYTYAGELLKSIKEHALYELESLAADKTKAEQARDMWTDRACYRVISIVKSLKQMTSRMTFVNQGGHRYPLIRMDMRNGDLPEKPEDIRLLLREYFVRTIDELSGQYNDFADVPEFELEKRMSDSQIVLTALKSRYPTLHVYKPQTTNVFLHESPKKHHYTEWETLNKGSVTEAKGSGGQLLAARTIVMMMLMTHKRQIRQTKQWSVLILDNPFGQAVSPHILDPIFAIAENLLFQWIVLAPPELIKLDVSRRFPVFWELELKRHTYGETVTERLQHGGRTFEGQGDLFGTWGRL